MWDCIKYVNQVFSSLGQQKAKGYDPWETHEA